MNVHKPPNKTHRENNPCNDTTPETILDHKHLTFLFNVKAIHLYSILHLHLQQTPATTPKLFSTTKWSCRTYSGHIMNGCYNNKHKPNEHLT